MSTPTRSGTARPIAALFATGLLLLGACSSDGGDDSSASSTTATTAAGAGSTTEADGTTTAPEGTEPTDPADPDAPPTTGGATPGDEGAFTEAIGDALVESLDPIEEEQATCIADEWVSTVGFDRFQRASADPQSIGRGDSTAWAPLEVDDDEAEALYAAVEDCGYDFPAAIRDSLAVGKSAEEAACFDDVLTDEIAADFMKSSFKGDSSETELMSLGEQCG